MIAFLVKRWLWSFQKIDFQWEVSFIYSRRTEFSEIFVYNLKSFIYLYLKKNNPSGLGMFVKYIWKAGLGPNFVLQISYLIQLKLTTVWPGKAFSSIGPTSTLLGYSIIVDLVGLLNSNIQIQQNNLYWILIKCIRIACRKLRWGWTVIYTIFFFIIKTNSGWPGFSSLNH